MGCPSAPPEGRGQGAGPAGAWARARAWPAVSTSEPGEVGRSTSSGPRQSDGASRWGAGPSTGAGNRSRWSRCTAGPAGTRGAQAVDLEQGQRGGALPHAPRSRAEQRRAERRHGLQLVPPRSVVDFLWCPLWLEVVGSGLEEGARRAPAVRGRGWRGLGPGTRTGPPPGREGGDGPGARPASGLFEAGGGRGLVAHGEHDIGDG